MPSAYRSTWILPDPARWSATRWATFSDGTGDPRQRIADFDGDGLPDHALFLCRIDGAHQDSAYAVIVRFASGRDTLLGVFSRAEAMGTLGAGLGVIPAGTTHHLGGDGAVPAPLYLENPGLSLTYYESAAVMWFWTRGTCHRVWIAD